MTNATVHAEKLSDNSYAYNVVLATDEGRQVATIAAQDKGHAARIADAINDAAWIEFTNEA